MALQSCLDGFLGVDDEDSIVATSRKAGPEQMLQIRSQTVKDTNPQKDIPTEEQGGLDQVEINYV